MLDIPDKDAASAMKKSRDPEQEKKKRSHHPDNHRSCQANATSASSVFSVGPCNPTSGQQHDNSGQLLPPVTTLLPHSTLPQGVVTNRNNMPPYPMSDSERPLSIAVTTNRNNRNPVPGGVTVTAVTTIPTTLPQVWPLTQCFMFVFV